MADFFFYGTLRHLPLLELVLGRAADGMDLAPGELPDHAVHWVRGEGFPVISRAPGATAQGLVLRGATEHDTARLRYYEGGFDYGLAEVEARTGAGPLPVLVFFPDTADWTPGAPFDLADWVRGWAAITMGAAAEAMAQADSWTPDMMAARWPAMCRRSAARLTAAARGGQGPFPVGSVEIAARENRHLGFYRLDCWRLRHPRFDGTTSDLLEREIFQTGEASVLLPYDPVRDEVLLIEQFRANVMAAGDPNPWVWEPVAGLIDPGETPEDAARREAGEEAGVEVRDLHLVGRAYSSTGSSTEFVHMFVGTCDFTRIGAGGGVPGEGEDIRSCILSFEGMLAALAAGEFRDMPLIVCAQWLAMNRDKLRRPA